MMMFLVLLSSAAMAIDEPSYTIVTKDGRIEVRRYAAYVVVETVEQAADMDAASTAGFRKLFKYISGGNTARTEISMTAPVTAERSQSIPMTAPVVVQSTEGGYTIGFVMPKEYTASTTPTPNDSTLRIREVPARTVAVIRFSGRWTEENFSERQQELTAWMGAHALRPIAPPMIARYDPPIMPWFLRRNEVQIPTTD